MKKVYEIPKMQLWALQTDVITSSSNEPVKLDDGGALGKNDRTWSEF